MTKQRVNTNGDDQTIHSLLEVGKYFVSFSGDLVSNCPELDVEFALVPVNPQPLITCPSSSKYISSFVTLFYFINNLLFVVAYVSNSGTPVISFASLPVSFPPTKAIPSFFTPNTPNPSSFTIIETYQFTLTSDAHFDASVDSDFLRGNLGLILYLLDTMGTFILVNGTNQYNRNIFIHASLYFSVLLCIFIYWFFVDQIQSILEPATYKFQIVIPPGTVLANMPSCIEYNFFLNMSCILIFSSFLFIFLGV